MAIENVATYPSSREKKEQEIDTLDGVTKREKQKLRIFRCNIFKYKTK